jgi:ATP-grasp domain, R2K clade family 3
VALIDHDALTDPGGGGRAAARVPDAGGMALYRGWMLRAAPYGALADALAARGVMLRTSAAQYRQAHELPGWYPALAPVTPQAVWTDGDDEPGFRLACERLGPGPVVLRDYVKSMKHYWREAAYISDLADASSAWKVAARFRELREDEFTGGFVLRRFEHFASSEARTWWVGGACRLGFGGSVWPRARSKVRSQWERTVMAD